MSNINYKKLMEIFNDIKIYYKQQTNPIPYIKSVSKALIYINSTGFITYKNFQNEVPKFILEKDSELYRTISIRQSTCFTNCIELSCKAEYANAMNELLDALEDYGNYEKRNVLSINEFFILSNTLEIYHRNLKKGLYRIIDKNKAIKKVRRDIHDSTELAQKIVQSLPNFSTDCLQLFYDWYNKNKFTDYEYEGILFSDILKHNSFISALVTFDQIRYFPQYIDDFKKSYSCLDLNKIFDDIQVNLDF